MYSSKSKSNSKPKSTLYSRVKNAASKGIQKRYFKGSNYSKPDYSQMAKDILALKSVINSEKKRFTFPSSGPLNFGQVNVNASGHYALDMTPIIGEGVTYSTRNGASIKLSSSFLEFQFYQQTNRSSGMRFKLYFVQVKGAIQTTSTFVSQFLNPNPFVSGTIYDYNSTTNPDYFGQYKIIYTKDVYLKDDSTTSDIIIKDVKIPLKYNKGLGHHIRYNGDTNTVADGQLMLLIVADSGNFASGVSSIANIPIIGGLTGANMNINFTHYYYDN
jgi:hypothetical protein